MPRSSCDPGLSDDLPIALRKEEVYMEQPPRFVAQGESDKVCRLQKSLYGLKQFSQALVRFGGNLVSWKSKKQNVVSRSSVESEYKVMAQSVCEIVWIHQLLSEIGFSITVPTKLWCDNQAALHIASNPVFHERNKHIEVDCYFIREKIQDGLVSTGYVKIKEQLGDILTKVVNGARISYLCNKLDMMDIFAPA
ncbi:putative mitochondrial protein [Cucumis melo var. makuwa]|uniref:Mitochondrial protein n=1 Tax=Cucumis melo var. makuwa TaxID=1194695 RepID=A0A5D3CL81_CUCMM|nr:putative mitochondrial protein [Cucumis melo var. makuwa]TYK12305.1 putative mitochondrial protein [Cucumis melo var. makuwa]